MGFLKGMKDMKATVAAAPGMIDQAQQMAASAQAMQAAQMQQMMAQQQVAAPQAEAQPAEVVLPQAAQPEAALQAVVQVQQAADQVPLAAPHQQAHH